MKVSKMMEEVWRWKDEVAKEIEGMSPSERIAYFHGAQQRIAYFHGAQQRLEEKTGKKLNLPQLARPQRRRRENET